MSTQQQPVNSTTSPVARETLAAAARDFLKAVAEAAIAKLGPRPERLQRSVWMVRSGPGSMSSREFQRKVFDHSAVSLMYQRMMRSDFPEQRQLGASLTDLGIPADETWFGFFLPLVRHWLKLPDPLTFEDTAIAEVLSDFVKAAIDGRVMSKSLYAIAQLDLASGPAILEKCISIRPITEEELWEFGDEDRFLPSDPFERMPSEEWNILDIEVQHTRGQGTRLVEAIRHAAIIGLRLASPGSLQVRILGADTSYGIRKAMTGGLEAQELGRWGGPYVLDSEVARRLKDAWSRLREIVESEDHYLRLSAQRLLDGGGRERADDAIIDYAIGLEALLTEGVQDELGYRLALRGATVLAWDGGNRQQFFNDLRDFYKVRSSIVHGSHVEQARLSKARSQGENALRDVWWWYFHTGCDLKKATEMIEARILN